MHKKYEELLRLFKESFIVEEIAMLLYWDKDVSMPSGGLKQRAEQIAFIAELSHKKNTAKNPQPTFGPPDSIIQGNITVFLNLITFIRQMNFLSI